MANRTIRSEPRTASALFEAGAVAELVARARARRIPADVAPEPPRSPDRHGGARSVAAECKSVAIPSAVGRPFAVDTAGRFAVALAFRCAIACDPALRAALDSFQPTERTIRATRPLSLP